MTVVIFKIVNKYEMQTLKKVQFIIISIFFYSKVFVVGEVCSKTDDNKYCDQVNNKNTYYRYILYDINPPEGFNLRRDVYMRLAVFVANLKHRKNMENFKLVLPPWSELFHWKSNEHNMHIPWSRFFDIKSLQGFAPVIELYEFFNEVGENYKQVTIDETYVLQNFEVMFETGNFEDKIAVERCIQMPLVNFYEYSNLTSNAIKCLSFHGPAAQLVNVLNNSSSRTFLFDHAEILLHDRYGDKIYWDARRSMRFNLELRQIATEFRLQYLNSSDERDNTIIPDDWKLEKPHRNAAGGPYLCVHLRRQDFLRGRPSQVPNLESAAKQIIKLLKSNELEKVFIATDAPLNEYNELKNKLPKKYEILKYEPSSDVLRKFKDGGVAIIEQIICAHSYYFVGTHESTYSFRIQEEREILGFPSERTFNRLCGGGKCDRPSIWKIVY